MIRQKTATIEILLAALWLLSSTCPSRILSCWGRAVRDRNASLKAQLPNFVIILTDDLDWTLGGTHASTLHRTRALIAEQGMTFTNWFVQTPVCCPSRAELLTGKYFHNLRVPSIDTSNKGCMHIDVAPQANHSFYQRDYFAQYFARWNYTVGIFGKHLNNANPTDFIPNGVDEMLINGGGEYLDPTFTVATRHGRKPQEVTYNNCTESTGMPCYSTSIIGNASLAWIQRHLQTTRSSRNHPQPFLALISVKAPHILDGPGFPVSIPAPWYSNITIPEQSVRHIPNYNHSATDHHWLVRSQAPMTIEEGQRVDDLYVSRLKTLISVDDLVESLVSELPLDNTYVLFTSDNGYRLGQFRMPMAKLHAYENDIRVPMMIRGPYIAKNTTSTMLSTHVNLMPTLLGLVSIHDQNHKTIQESDPRTTPTFFFAASTTTGGTVVPETMDGTNLASCIINLQDNTPPPTTATTTVMNSSTSSSSCPSPSTLLIEYTSLGNVVRYSHLVDTYNHSFVALRILMHPRDNNDGQYDNDSSTTGTTTTRRTRSMMGTTGQRNLKYVEYRDSRWDWNGTIQPPLEQELFDLDQDPYEMTNLITKVSPIIIQALKHKLQRYLQCQGESCRWEQLVWQEK